jgi:adenylate cyclase
MSPEKFKRKLAAILSADVKGYSRLIGEDEEGTIRTLNAYMEVITGFIQQHRGRVVGTAGDSVLAEFASVVDAVRCAVEIQEELKERNKELPEGRRMEFRIGVNLGDVVEEGDDILGNGVNIASRVESLAEAGGICISGTVYDQVKKKLALGYEYIGEQAVKNITEPVRVYRAQIEPEAAPSKVIGEKKPVGKGLSKAVLGIIAVAVIAGAGILYQFVLRPSPSKIEVASKEKMAFPLPDKPSIAVLPFTNLSGDPQQEFFSDGLTEDIITALSKVPGLFVIARNSTFTYKGKPVKVQRVAEDLGVRYVLEGSVQKAGDRVRITAQLIDALNGRHIWSERYDTQLKDIFALQDKLTLQVMKGLDVTYWGDKGRILAKGTDNMEAYLKVLQARDLQEQWNRESNVQARKLIEEAIRLDPQYASAYFILSTVTQLDVWLGISKSPRESHMKAIELIQKAISLDDSLTVAHALLGMLYVTIGEHEKGIAAGERAIERDPNSPDAHVLVGGVLNYSGRPQEAIALIEKAWRMNPTNPPPSYYVNAALAYRLTGRYEESVKMWKRLLSRWPNNIVGHAGLLLTYGAWGRDEEVRAVAQDLLRIDPKFSAERYVQVLPFKNPTLRVQYLEFMRKAGLK